MDVGLECIKRYSPHLLQKFRRLAEQDEVGHPVQWTWSIPTGTEEYNSDLQQWQEVHEIIPASAHVPKHLYELMLVEKAFGATSRPDSVGFDGFDVIEIGAGYGAMANVMAEFHNVESYTVVDLGTVNLLVEKYLTAIGSKLLEGSGRESSRFRAISVVPEADAGVETETGIPLVPVKYDLFLSFWCMSEQKQHTVRQYIKQYVAHATRGYIQLNYDNFDDDDRGNEMVKATGTYGVLQIFKLIYAIHPSAVLLPPPPCKVYIGNHRITWGPDVGMGEKTALHSINSFQVPNWG